MNRNLNIDVVTYLSSMTLKRPPPVDADLYDRLVIEAGRRFGATTGSVKKAIEQAIELWLKPNLKRIKTS